MGFLSSIRNAFVEEVPNENSDTEMEEMVDSSGEMNNIDAGIDEVNTDTLIDDIYAQNDLYDKSQSIFKVEELINSLPKEMVTETKRASVLSILGSFGLTATEVQGDGEKRTKVLISVKDQINLEAKDTVSDKNAQIEEFKKSIANLESEITEIQKETKTSNELIDAEFLRIKNLVDFVGV